MSGGFREGPTHQPLDRVVSAVDFLRVVRQPDRLDNHALRERLASAFHFQVLDQHDGISVWQHIARGVPNFERGAPEAAAICQPGTHFPVTSS
jgi:hypothetical protein